MHHSALLRVQGGIRHALLSNKCRLTTLACRGAVGGSAHLRLAAALASTAAAPLQRAQAAEVGAGAAPAGPAARTLAAGFATTGGRDSRVRTAGYRPALEFDPAVVSLHGETGLRTLCIDLPLADDAELQEEYASFLGHIRVGKLLEDLDSAAGALAYDHCGQVDPTQSELTIVTASCDRIELQPQMAAIRRDVSLRVLGAVTDAPPELVMSAGFTMVARTRLGNASVEVPRLPDPISPVSAQLRAAAEKRQQARMAGRSSRLDRVAPTAEELALIHDLWLNSGAFSEEDGASAVGLGKTTESRPDGAGATGTKTVRVGETVTESVVLCHSQDRNVHGKIFGGYLMRQSFELAFCTAYKHTHVLPSFRAVGDISFLAPVEIGSILQLRASVEHVQKGGSLISVRVTARVIDPERGTSKATNSFHFVFDVPGGDVTAFVPHTYKESMRWIAAHRREALAAEFRNDITDSNGDGAADPRFTAT